MKWGVYSFSNVCHQEYEELVKEVNARSQSSSAMYWPPPSPTTKLYHQKSSGVNLSAVVKSQYSGHQPADSQSRKPVICPSCTRMLWCLRSPCVKTIWWDIESIFLARSSALLYSVSEGNPPDQAGFRRYSLNSSSDSKGPAKWLGTRTLRIAVPNKEHTLFTPHGLFHLRIAPK